MAAAEARGVAEAPPAVDDRTGCLEEARSGFDRAAEAVGAEEYAWSIGGRSVLVRIAGRPLVAPLTTALAHQPPAAGPAEVTINCWDAAATGIPMPRVPESAADGGRSAAERIAAPDRIRVQYQFGRGALCVYDRSCGTAWVPYEDAGILPSWEYGAPLLTALHWGLLDHGRQLVHGAALGTDRGGVVVVARGGSGKSSTALSTLSPAGRASGLRFAGDDYCLLDSDDGTPRAHTLYGTGKLAPDQAARFPDLLAGPVLNPVPDEDEKIVVFASKGDPALLIHEFPILSLVVPVIGPGPCRVEPVSAGIALRALAPSTVLQLPGSGGESLAALAALARRVPTHALHLSPDPREAPAVLARLIGELAA